MGKWSYLSVLRYCRRYPYSSAVGTARSRICEGALKSLRIRPIRTSQLNQFCEARFRHLVCIHGNKAGEVRCVALVHTLSSMTSATYNASHLCRCSLAMLSYDMGWIEDVYRSPMIYENLRPTQHPPKVLSSSWYDRDTHRGGLPDSGHALLSGTTCY